MDKKNEKQGRLAGALRSRSFRVGSYSLAASLIVIAVAVLAVLAAGTLPSRLTKFDMSTQGYYSLSPQTQELAASLEQEVDIYLLTVAGSEDETISALLERYEQLSDKLRVTVVDPVANPTFATQYTDALRYSNSLIVRCGERSRFVDYTDIYVPDYTQYYTTYDQNDITYNFNAESAITSAIDYVTSADLPRLYSLTGHGESALESSFAQSVESGNFLTESLSLLTAEGVPADCDCLFINAPTADLSESEAEKLGAYLAGGGKLLLITGYIGEQLPRLEALMGEYGCTLTEGLVVERDTDHYVYGYPDCLLPSLASHDITQPVSAAGLYVVAPGAQGIALAETLPEGVSVTPLLETSPEAYAITDRSTAEYREGDPTGPFALGVAVTAGETSLVWFSSAYLLNDSYNNAFGGANADLFLNSLNWLCQREANITIHAKTLSSGSLTLTTRQASLMGTLVCILVPLLFAVAGAVVVICRRRGK